MAAALRMVVTTCRIRLIRRQVGSPDDLAPSLGFVGEKASEVAGRSGKRRATQIRKLYPQFWVGEPCVDLPVELFDNLAGCVSGRDDPVPHAHFIARHRLAEGRDVRQGGPAAPPRGPPPGQA